MDHFVGTEGLEGLPIGAIHLALAGIQLDFATEHNLHADVDLAGQPRLAIKNCFEDARFVFEFDLDCIATTAHTKGADVDYRSDDRLELARA